MADILKDSGSTTPDESPNFEDVMNQRRLLVAGMAVLLVGGTMTWKMLSHQDAPKQKPNKSNTPLVRPDADDKREEDDGNVIVSADVLRQLEKHPVAKLDVLGKPAADDETLMIVIHENGAPVAETIHHMNDNNWIANNREERRQDPPEFAEEPETDIAIGVASGFITEHADKYWYVISNRHVLARTARTFEDLMSMDKTDDVAVAPGEIMGRCEGDKYPLQLVSVSKDMTSAELPKHAVRISGVGSDIYRITGKPFFFEESPDGERQPEALAGKLALVIDTTHMRPQDLIGMSGSRVEDETGKVVGIFHSAPSVKGLPKRCLALFSGPEALRRRLNEAQERRKKESPRYTMQLLLQQLKADQGKPTSLEAPVNTEASANTEAPEMPK